jgi:hypothetical protein
MKRIPVALRRSLAGDARLWQVWWLGGIPVALAASAFTVAAELARDASQHGAGALLDTIKLVIYLVWFCAAWRCARNVEHPAWTALGQCAIATCLVLTAITF